MALHFCCYSVSCYHFSSIRMMVSACIFGQVKKNLAATKSNAAADGRTKGKPSLLMTTQSQSTNNLIPVVPILQTLSTQVADREGFSLGRSFDKLDEAHIGGHRPLSHFEKRTSSHSIGLQGSSQDSIGYNTCSNDSLDNILESPSLKITY